MRRLFILVMLSSFIANAQFKRYVKSFERYYNVKTKVVVMYYPLKFKTAIAIPSRAMIIVDPKKFQSLGRHARRWVMYHELLHAHFRMSHRDDGLMHWKHPSNVTKLRFEQERYKIKQLILNKQQ